MAVPASDFAVIITQREVFELDGAKTTDVIEGVGGNADVDDPIVVQRRVQYPDAAVQQKLPFCGNPYV